MSIKLTIIIDGMDGAVEVVAPETKAVAPETKIKDRTYRKQINYDIIADIINTELTFIEIAEKHHVEKGVVYDISKQLRNRKIQYPVRATATLGLGFHHDTMGEEEV
jgi:hypothetical protein